MAITQGLQLWYSGSFPDSSTKNYKLYEAGRISVINGTQSNSKDDVKQRIKRIEERKIEIGSKHRRKLKKYSNNFNIIFTFFFNLYHKDIITFCGSKHDIIFDINGLDVKECFRLWEDGFYKNGKNKIVTRHPNILNSVLIGKKGWGLWVDEWSNGIVEWSFTEEEIMDVFHSRNLEIPQSLLREFQNKIDNKKYKRNLKEIKRREDLNKVEEININLQKEIEKLHSGGMWV